MTDLVDKGFEVFSITSFAIFIFMFIVLAVVLSADTNVGYTAKVIALAMIIPFTGALCYCEYTFIIDREKW